MYAHPDEVEPEAVNQLISVAESPLPVWCDLPRTTNLKFISWGLLPPKTESFMSLRVILLFVRQVF